MTDMAMNQKQPAKQRERKSIHDLTDLELDKLLDAWRHIQDIDAGQDNSFFDIAGYHGEPFRGAGYGNSQWWGGYCHHGNILFPTWHRAYLLRLEEALRSAPNCADVTLPYWDESDDQTANKGIPPIFLQPQHKGKRNPLYSYTLKRRIVDRLSSFPDADYSKPEGYETCRYPYSGLSGQKDEVATKQHNDFINRHFKDKTNELLNSNVTDWLNMKPFHDTGGNIHTANTRWKIRQCLNTKEYTVFSNTTSAQRWNDDHFRPTRNTEQLENVEKSEVSVSLESPHNDIHLAIGGVQIPGQNADQYPGANGDMGENDTASFDPIFYFHHCFIDYLFWTWQDKHGKTDGNKIGVLPEYPGTNSVDSQGPTPGIAGNQWLNLQTDLKPFKIKECGLGADNRPVNSNDVLNIGTVPYKYVPPVKFNKGSVFVPGQPRLDLPSRSPPTLRISGINRGNISGSFAMAISHKDEDGQTRVRAIESVLSRWHVRGCANCQNHLNTTAFVPLYELDNKDAKKQFDHNQLAVHLHTRDNPPGERIQDVTLGYIQN